LDLAAGITGGSCLDANFSPFRAKLSGKKERARGRRKEGEREEGRSEGRRKEGARGERKEIDAAACVTARLLAGGFIAH
jgi:hypothetical protein